MEQIKWYGTLNTASCFDDFSRDERPPGRDEEFIMSHASQSFSEERVEMPSLRSPDMFTVGYLKHLDFCMDVGLVARTRQVTDLLVLYDLAELPALLPILERAKAWLPEATRYEAIHGNGSLLDRSHPRYLRAAAKRATRQIGGKT